MGKRLLLFWLVSGTVFGGCAIPESERPPSVDSARRIGPADADAVFYEQVALGLFAPGSCIGVRVRIRKDFLLEASAKIMLADAESSDWLVFNRIRVTGEEVTALVSRLRAIGVFNINATALRRTLALAGKDVGFREGGSTERLRVRFQDTSFDVEYCDLVVQAVNAPDVAEVRQLNEAMNEVLRFARRHDVDSLLAYCLEDRVRTYQHAVGAGIPATPTD